MTQLLVFVGLFVAIGGLALAYRHRPQASIEAGISSFRREMRALAPPEPESKIHPRPPSGPVHRPDLTSSEDAYEPEHLVDRDGHPDRPDDR